MAFTLPELPYPSNALEPSIDARTMEIHHGKHHNAYVTNLNTAISGHADLEAMSIAEICSNLDKVPDAIRTAVRNNGGGHYNHSLFWTIMGPGQGGEPAGDLATAITGEFGSFDEFKAQFAKAAATRFGSGWACLGVRDDGSLCVCSTANQDNALMSGCCETACRPILMLDVWEHAYYLNYQNRRPDYVSAWWDVVNWNKVAEYYAQANKAPVAV
jgi:Fe-Mn family superoxide dismutase